MNIMVRGLDGAMERQEAISNNIANANTPGYKRQDVDFQTALQNEMKNTKKSTLRTTHRKHGPGLDVSREDSFSTKRLSGFRYKNDGGSVDIDTEMAELAKNNIYYNTLVQQLNTKFNMVNTVIERGGN